MLNPSALPPAITIRTAIPADAAAMADIYCDARKTQYSPEVYQKLIDNPAFPEQFSLMVARQDDTFKCWVAVTAEGEVLGFSATQPTLPPPDLLIQSKFGYVSTYIKRSAKAQGLGTRLFNHNMHYCRHHTNIDYVLGLQYRGNPASVKISDDAGFEVMGEFDKLTDFPAMSFICWHAKQP